MSADPPIEMGEPLMARYRLVHVGAAALLSAAAVTTINVAHSVFAGATTVSAYVPTVPCRLVDTRSASVVGLRTTPIGPGETITLAVSGTNGECTIPSTATAISTNVTIDNPTAPSFLTVFQADAARSHTSNLNWQASSAPVANQVTVGLSATGAINIFNNAGTVDVIIDIFGYYEPGSGAPGPQGVKGDKGDKGDTGDAALAGLQCTNGQTITWNNTSGAWDCTNTVVDTDTLATLSCTVNQSIRWDGSAWECRSEPIVATLSRVAGGGFPCCGIAGVFQAYSPNVDQSTICDGFLCQIRLIDVLDHTSCQVSLTGNSNDNSIAVTTTTTEITIEPLFILNPGEPFYVNISCQT
jgi:hypothetical protein